VSANHPIGDEDLELLALGVIMGEACVPIRAHVAVCEDCARRLAEARGRVAMLSLAAPEEAPSAGARAKLLDRIRVGKAPAAERIPEARVRDAGVKAPRWWNNIWAPAAAVLAIATILLWITDRRIDDQLHDLQQQVAAEKLETQHMQELASMLAANDTKTAALTPTAQITKGWGRIKYNSRIGMVCYTGDLPAPPPKKEYQMWIVPEMGAPISVGTFLPAKFNDGHMCMAKMPEGVSCKSFAVTVEPMGGMPHPTGPMVLTGTGF
jgi:anti-sigma-K factor RskA